VALASSYLSGSQLPLTQPFLYTTSAEALVLPTTSLPVTLVSPTPDLHIPTARAPSILDPAPVPVPPVVGLNTKVPHDDYPYEAVNVTPWEGDYEMGQLKTKATIGVLSTIIIYMCANSLLRATHPEVFIWQDEDREESSWIKTSRFWLDRKCCRWLGVCGGQHMHFISAKDKFGHLPKSSRKHKSVVDHRPQWDWQNAWTEGNDRPEDWSDDERVLREIPDYVMEYAPLVHLYSGEQFWPCDIAEHLYHITPTLNYTPVQSEQQHPTLQTLDGLNEWQRGRWVFLTSNDNVEERPEWLEGEKNIPRGETNPDDLFEDNEGWIHKPGRTYLQSVKDALADVKEWFAPGMDGLEQLDDFQMTASGQPQRSKPARHPHHDLKRSTPWSHKQAPPDRLRGGRSDAPAVLVTVNKGHGIVDAFWFFFYSFNLGNVVLNVRFGNHVGDWEHTAIRFQDGVPKAVFFSEHNFGSAYSYEAVEKIGKRPVIYSAYGTHAMYAVPGTHPYILPWGILHDVTDRGPLWDPTLNSHSYTYDFKNETLRSSNYTPNAPIGWFDFAGHWGDKFYPLGDKRQYRFAGQYHYVNGPLGPKFKHLGRKKICQGPDSSPCVIKNWLGSGDKIGTVPHAGDDDQGDGDL
jgi:hypothetical protein